ncbi:hypothetical protein CIPAW_12G099100 [Carya illinoinensis]|uniref:DNA-directed RNA polymerase n=1 Tax=Carya illinoinensis TaxID=32201 RepID=A0A8T1NZH1_CARIL|nr:hypothetical protein CIPAW_12G099100 [Carya illinoinensis]
MLHVYVLFESVCLYSISECGCHLPETLPAKISDIFGPAYQTGCLFCSIPSPMDHEFSEEQQVPSGHITAIRFSFSTQTDTEKVSVISIDAVSEVTDPKLGLPNPSSQCSTCGARDLKYCEGHFGVIKFPFTILHPYFLSEVAKILNKICPGCKSVRQELKVKVRYFTPYA